MSASRVSKLPPVPASTTSAGTLVAAAIALLAAASACATGTTIGDGSGGSGGVATGVTGSSSKSSTSTMGTSSTGSMQTTSTGMSTTDTSSSTGTPCSESPCKLTLPQCGCPASRQCTIDGTGMRVCNPVGTQAIGQACSAANDCAPGGICLGATTGSCFKFCSSDAECVSPGGKCLLKLNDGMGGSVPNVTMCSQNCDPASASSCAVAGLGCQIATDTATQKTYTSCIDAGSGGDTAPCPNGASDCQAGFGCFTVGTQNECLQWCKVGITTCPGGLTCQDVMVSLGGTSYGACN